MSRRGLALILLVLVACTTGCGSRHASPAGAVPNSPLPAATVHQAQQEHKPVMVTVTAAWCTGCTQLKEQALSLPEVVTSAKRFVVLDVDGDKQPSLKGRLRVTGYPTIVFFDARGKEISRVRGAVPYQILLDEMDEAVRKAG